CRQSLAVRTSFDVATKRRAQPEQMASVPSISYPFTRALSAKILLNEIGETRERKISNCPFARPCSRIGSGERGDVFRQPHRQYAQPKSFDFGHIRLWRRADQQWNCPDQG